MGRFFAFTLGLSAFLLFTVQPMVARMLLPYLGGGAVVWNTSMVFFQTMLVAGYLWAHVQLGRFGVARSRWLHPALLLAGCVVFPIAVEPSDAASQQPIAWLLTQLTVSIALPFFALATTAPLLQRWYADATGDDPYWLYAASNIGSFAALLAYPLALEPLLGVRAQSWGWAAAYAVLVCATGISAYVSARRGGAGTIAASTRPTDDEVGRRDTTDARVSTMWPTRLRWTALAGVPSALLIAVTTEISTDLASVPLLWVVPLAIYLMSFVVVFAKKRVVSVRQAQVALVVFSTPIVAMLSFDISKPIWAIMLAHLGAFFAVCLLYHGQLAAERPPSDRLTDFYLWMSIGGALGGASVSLGAPALFSDSWEYPLVFAIALLWLGRELAPEHVRRMAAAGGAAGLATALVFIAGGRVSANELDPVLVAFVLGLVGLGAGVTRWPRYGTPILVVVGVAAGVLVSSAQGVIERRRSYFASYWIGEKSNEAGRFHVLYHGHVRHGAQSIEPSMRELPISYYHPTSPIGQVFTAMRERNDRRPVAVVGLGIGGLAPYVLPGQSMTFYEIDPVVAQIARDDDYFTYLAQCEGECPVKIGDGRVLLGEEPNGEFQMIVLDAYSSDAIPTHLLTVEAMELYMSKLAEDGVLLLHVSNTFLDVGRVAENVAATHDYAISRYRWWPREKYLYALQVNRSDWVAVARNRTVLNTKLGVRWEKRVGSPDGVVWTDDYANVAAIYTWE
jgi:hypothetical protein